jgi:release factor glutamine methyltransferase
MAELEPEVAQHEDRVALHGGDDGLDVVRELLDGAGELLRPQGPRELWLEVARRHPAVVAEVAGPRWELLDADKAQDLAGNPRFVRLRWLGGVR